MSTGPKRPYNKVMAAAQSVINWLAPNYERIKVADSLRRHKDTIGDIEIVAIPTPICGLLAEPTGDTLVDAVYRRRFSTRNVAETASGNEFRS